MIYKTEAIIQHSALCIIFSLLVADIFRLVYLYYINELLADSKFITIWVLIPLLVTIFLLEFIVVHLYISEIKKILQYVIVFLLLYISTGYLLYTFVITNTLSKEAFATMYVGIITLVTFIVSIVKYWDLKQLKWFFSVLPNEDVYNTHFSKKRMIIPKENIQIEIVARSNKENTALNFAGVCWNKDIRTVVNKRKGYLSKIKSCSVEEKSNNKNTASYVIYDLPKILEKHKYKRRIWIIFFDNCGEIWGISFDIEKMKKNNRKETKYENKYQKHENKFQEIKGTNLVYDVDTKIEYWKDSKNGLTPRYKETNGTLFVYDEKEENN